MMMQDGLGTETGIDLPSEIHGDIQNIMTSPRDVEYDTASFGQGIATTPIETIRALSSIANDGTWVPGAIRATLAGHTGVIIIGASGIALRPTIITS